MKVTKIGHCCLIVEIDGKRILTDPGAYSDGLDAITDIDAVLITHEHSDHIHVPSVKNILKQNPNASLYTNSGVKKILDNEEIVCTLHEGSGTRDVAGIAVEAFDCKHEEIFEDIGQVQNTAYFIGSQLFYPGDSFFNPEREVPVLALPVGGPWCTIGDAVRYALAVNPKKAFPVHDGIPRPNRIGSLHTIPQKVLAGHSIEFTPIVEGGEHTFI